MCRHCWQPIHIFHCLISCLHQCFTNIVFPSQISNERRTYSLCPFERLSSLSLHNCKHENSPFEVTFWSLSELPISFVSSCLLRLSFYWSSHNQQYPLISFHTSMDCITRSYWRYLAFGFVFCDLPEHWFIELHGGQVLSFVILIIDPCYSSWRINLCNINLTPWLNVWLARTWFWVLNCMSVFEHYGIALTHIGIRIWHS